MRHARLLLVLALLAALPVTEALAQSGKIAGTVRDSGGDPLPGVNVVIDGTTQGSVTDGDGHYTILNVRPGVYTIRASFIGYTPQATEGVRVSIDLTTEVNFELREEAVGLGEMVVVAQRPIVQRDISANVASLNAAEIENLPIVSIDQVVGLQAGVEAGLSIRGSGMDEVGFVVDGMSMREGRSNRPFTGISYTSIQEMQIQTGGFSAEYGNVRSGLINVVTREGEKSRYTVDAIVRYAPPSRKYFGMSPGDPEAYWLRPYFDPGVAFTGTHNAGSPWDAYTRRQYPRFNGFNAIAKTLAEDADPNNNLTAQQLQEIFKFRHRKSFEITEPDYEVDMSVGGPVPAVSRRLGNLRFFGSFRQTQNAYVIPQQRESYRERSANLKVTTDLARGMKLQLLGMYGLQAGLNSTAEGWPEMFTGEMPTYPWSRRGIINSMSSNETLGLFGYSSWVPMDVERNMFGMEFSHVLSQSTFYTARLQRYFTDYSSFPGRKRDTTTVAVIGGYRLDEAPFGWEPAPANDFTGVRLGGHWGPARDTSKVADWSAKLDLTSQVNPFTQLKTGIEYIYSNYHINHGEVDSFNIAHANPKYRWHRTPQQGAAYSQAKLEFQGMVANLGLRLDYFDPSGEWYLHDTYDPALSAKIGAKQLDEALEKERVERQFSLSPRVGISFPITENSKLFLNYGHFRQALDPSQLFVVENINTGAVGWIGNPNHPMPKTVAYEMGYEHNLFNQFLVRLTGYYKALGNQPRSVTYISLDEEVRYRISNPENYEDIRGFEATLTKNAGRWVRGFLNYTFMAVKRGNFGFAEYYQNRVAQARYERDSRAHYQERPVPEPFARFNVEFLVPPDFGPLLGDWRLNLLGEWRAGQFETWTGGGGAIVGLENNVRWKDYYNLDLRFSKNIDAGFGQFQLFADVNNVLNLQHLNRYVPFEGANDFEDYMRSLHLPANTFDDVAAPYTFVPGDDRPGDYRKEGVEFVPIEVVKTVANVTNPLTRPLYYDLATSKYMSFENGAWREADQGRVDQVLRDKAYIDMPNEQYFRFLNPRNLRLGMRIRF